jgi:hypothetical protein
LLLATADRKPCQNLPDDEKSREDKLLMDLIEQKGWVRCPQCGVNCYLLSLVKVGGLILGPSLRRFRRNGPLDVYI